MPTCWILFTRRLAERARWSAPETMSRSVGTIRVSCAGSASRPSRRKRTALVGLTSRISSSCSIRTDEIGYVIGLFLLYTHQHAPGNGTISGGLGHVVFHTAY